MLSQHHAIGLQTGCMVIVLAPVVEAARLPRVCPMALGYGLPPCNNNNGHTMSPGVTMIPRSSRSLHGLSEFKTRESPNMASLP